MSIQTKMNFTDLTEGQQNFVIGEIADMECVGIEDVEEDLDDIDDEYDFYVVDYKDSVEVVLKGGGL